MRSCAKYNTCVHIIISIITCATTLSSVSGMLVVRSRVYQSVYTCVFGESPFVDLSWPWQSLRLGWSVPRSFSSTQDRNWFDLCVCVCVGGVCVCVCGWCVCVCVCVSVCVCVHVQVSFSVLWAQDCCRCCTCDQNVGIKLLSKFSMT